VAKLQWDWIYSC